MNTFITGYRTIDKLVRESYSTFGLKCLSEYEIDGKKALSFFHKKIEGIEPKRNYNSFQFFNELSFISDDIVYFTALTYLLKPYINDPLKENRTYFQSIEDKRYMSYSNILYQTFYNYWDRIGDLLNYYFETNLEEKNIYLFNVLKNVNDFVKSSKNYKELKTLYDEKISKFLKPRKDIVHYIQLSSQIFSGTFINYNDEEYLIELQKYKESLPALFKEHIEYTLTGFKYAVQLINEK